ncbi:cinnamoyl-CoA reductase CAD2-like [Vicia villosa]|uniref:cinnamoyl-CoA reductase CAD2-like n=1 Tax=Vicia villosa TaxID=3911 RepID=UPI00273AECB5|nr:cinnamoyl-CoA reductase CAD2-like [Vicia villosa]
MVPPSLAEAAAWDFANENKIEMVVINTTMVVGHLLQPEVKESVKPILDLINASGRYCLLERMVHCSQLAQILHDLYQTLQILDNCEDDEPYMPLYQFSKENINSLGIEFIPLEGCSYKQGLSLKHITTGTVRRSDVSRPVQAYDTLPIPTLGSSCDEVELDIDKREDEEELEEGGGDIDKDDEDE